MKTQVFRFLATGGLLLAVGASASSQTAAPPACQRLEAQLVALDRGNDDPARVEAGRRAEDAANRQQIEVDRLVVQGRRTGCENTGFFSIFSSPPPQCGQLNAQIQRARDLLERLQNQVEQLHGGNTERAAQRRSLLIALSDNNCGPQYRQAALQRGGSGFLDSLFGGRAIYTPDATNQEIGSNFRTICVRTCDGYYFPVSFSVPSARFADDAQTCQRMCPAAQVSLYAYHNPGEEVEQAVSTTDGRPYTELPTAFQYRREFNAACSCRGAGQSWADAMKVSGGDTTVEQGDIVVNEDRSKKMSIPRDASGRLLKPTLPPTSNAGSKTADAPAATTEPPKGKVRSVGPTFVPTH
jgi:hypothetical protein